MNPPPSQITTASNPSSAYVHIPFCRRRCYYCDFPVKVVGDRSSGDNSSTIAHYVEVLVREIAITPAPGRSLDTVFFGGGTPSLLSISQLERILDALDRQFGIGAGAEISMEMDPGTFDREKLEGVCAAGVNRVSMGVQAFDDKLLKICGRSHLVEDIFAAVESIRQVGVADWSIDLISGLPKQTLDMWQASLEAAIAISPSHISCYDLIVEPKTAFHRYYQAGVSPLPSDETTAGMYRMAAEMLAAAGYEHYEISNYAQSGYQCRHNRVYWENRPYYGFGMGATSYVGGQRFGRPRRSQDYYQWVETFVAAGGAIDSPPTPADELLEEVLLETLMLGLRLAEGLELASLAEKFGKSIPQRLCKCLEAYRQEGWVEFLEYRHNGSQNNLANGEFFPGDRIRLSDPEGFLFSNTILAALFSEFS